MNDWVNWRAKEDNVKSNKISEWKNNVKVAMTDYRYLLEGSPKAIEEEGVMVLYDRWGNVVATMSVADYKKLGEIDA